MGLLGRRGRVWRRGGGHRVSSRWSTRCAAGRLGALRLDGTLEGLDLVALGLAPGLAGHQGGEQAEQPVGAEEDRRADPAGADVERGRDQRGEAGDDRGHLVGQRGAGGAGVGVEQLAEPGALHPGQRVLADRVADDERDDDQHRGAGVDREEQRDAPQDHDRGAQDVHRAAADLVGPAPKKSSRRCRSRPRSSWRSG